MRNNAIFKGRCFVLYVTSDTFPLSQNALYPGLAIIGFIITFAAVLQNLLKSALNIKAENDLTV
ncbi:MULTISPECIES: DUF2975 domain-containing protein [Bacillaceae]|uniref:DUF2975 domain-containing protein n=1 Tax=Bacillaceae TaxID=186817 RepID=UPI000E7098C8|nr:DUF2975 domain-containing protein [Bacillus sp. PK3_68]